MQVPERSLVWYDCLVHTILQCVFDHLYGMYVTFYFSIGNSPFNIYIMAERSADLFLISFGLMARFSMWQSVELYKEGALKLISKLHSSVMPYLALDGFNTFNIFSPLGFVLHKLLLFNSFEHFSILYNGPKMF